MDDFDASDDENNDQIDSDFAEAFIRLCPHLLPDLQEATDTATVGEPRLTLRWP